MNDTTEFLSKLKGVKANKNGWMASCPAHDDKKQSLSISQTNDGKILIKCFAMCTTDEILSAMGLTMKDLFLDTYKKEKLRITKNYDYLDEDGNLLFQVCRKPNKNFLFRRPDPNNDGKWIWNAEGVIRVLYHLPEILNNAKRPVFITEGEKDADRLRELGYIATTNPGGAGKWRKNYNNCLKDRRVVIFPDNDDPGMEHALQVAHSLRQVTDKIKIVELPGLPEKGDVSDWLDNGGTDEQFKIIVKGTPLFDPKKQPLLASAEQKKREPVVLDLGAIKKAPFKCLGHNKGMYYYLPHNSQQIKELTEPAHTKLNLIALAGLTYWECYFMTGKSVNWDLAADAMYHGCHKIGIFDPNNIRGSGAWKEDNGDIVIHEGNQLIVNGEVKSIDEHNSKYIYEQGVKLNLYSHKYLTSREASQFLELANMFSWEKEIYAKLFVGWCVLAPICGVLPWRPHIWITGSKGTGKTWIFENTVHPLIERAGVIVQLTSTEAGIRQYLGNNAFPVVFDEAETDDQFSQDRIKRVVELMRGASSDTISMIVKGSASGQAIQYRYKAMFCLASVKTHIEQAADTSRISILTLIKPDLPKPELEEMFQAICAKSNEVMTTDWCDKMRARSIAMIPTLLPNIETFTKAFSNLHGRRPGDQTGSLMAASVASYNDSLIDLSYAKNYIEEQGAGEEQSNISDDTDEDRCLNHILEAELIVSADGKTLRRSVSELIIRLDSDSEDDDINFSEAKSTLARYGLNAWTTGEKIDKQYLWISDSHSGIKKILRLTPWASQWRGILCRIYNSETKKSIRFGGLVQRAIGIPLDYIRKE